MENDGRKRQAVKVKCLNCGKSFLKALRFIKPDVKNYCSLKCANAGHRKRITLKCAMCNKLFERVPSKIKNSKSGLYFCSKHCKDKAQRIGGCKEIQPSHYGKGLTTYRSIAFREYDAKCEICGYSNHLEILEVHHIDKNRENNDISNLIILCPNCHAALTYKHATLKDRKLVWKKQNDRKEIYHK